MTKKPAPIRDRIIAALETNGGRMKYHALLQAVFPTDQFPNAFGAPNRGGPVGCSMALSRAIRVYGFGQRFDGEGGVSHSIISMGTAQKGGAA